MWGKIHHQQQRTDLHQAYKTIIHQEEKHVHFDKVSPQTTIYMKVGWSHTVPMKDPTTLRLIFFELFNLSIRVLRKKLKCWENWAVARKATSDLPLYNSWALGFCTLPCYILLPLGSKKNTCMKQAIGRCSRFGYCSTAESSHISHQVDHTWRSLESLLMKAIEFQVIIKHLHENSWVGLGGFPILKGKISQNL